MVLHFVSLVDDMVVAVEGGDEVIMDPKDQISDMFEAGDANHVLAKVRWKRDAGFQSIKRLVG